jgi:hypothetical protein
MITEDTENPEGGAEDRPEPISQEDPNQEDDEKRKKRLEDEQVNCS